MKKTIIYIFITLLLTSCYDMDLNPLSQGSSENWYTTEEELMMSVRSLYNIAYWSLDDDSYTDDWTNRNEVNNITGGTIDGLSSIPTTLWTNKYAAIGRANELLANLGKAQELGISADLIKKLEAETKLVKAIQHASLVAHYGDVVYVSHTIPSISEAFKLGRTDKKEVMQYVYEDIDKAIEVLDKEIEGEMRANSKGVAYAFKARAALYVGDYAIAADAAKKCIDLGVYSLHNDFADLFLSSTKTSKEFILTRPRSIEQSIYIGTQAFTPRTAGGWAQYVPSWDLLCAFLCADGKPIDESPLFNPREPFLNRDPRCTKTIVEFETRHVGFEYNPHPNALTTLNYNTGAQVKNTDNRAVAQYASYNGLVWKKWVDDTWNQNGHKADKNEIVMRYADVLLMYAEAKIELGDIDQTVLDAINDVRARAYGVARAQTTAYPSVTTTDATELRKIVRLERRMEFAFEGLRYMDIIRWKLAEKVLNLPIYGLLDPANLKSDVVDKGLWFFSETPKIDEDGIADFSSLYQNQKVKLLVQRKFDANRQYLWPIPSKEILINDNIKQNPGY